MKWKTVRTVPLVVLACSLLGSGTLEAGIVSGNVISGAITLDGATPGTYTFTDFNASAPATLVSATLTGLSTGVLQLNTSSPPDYFLRGINGDRLIVTLVNNTGYSLAGIEFDLSSTTFDLSINDPIEPSRGSYSSGLTAYTSDPNQRVTSPGVTAAATQVNIVFDSLLAPGDSTAFGLMVMDNSSSEITDFVGTSFQLSETPSAVPEPATFVLAGAALAGFGMLRKRSKSSYRS